MYVVSLQMARPFLIIWYIFPIAIENHCKIFLILASNKRRLKSYKNEKKTLSKTTLLDHLKVGKRNPSSKTTSSFKYTPTMLC